jgi:hypothetical protein
MYHIAIFWFLCIGTPANVVSRVTTLECELLDREQFRTPAEARRAVFDYIEGWSRYAGDPRLLC